MDKKYYITTPIYYANDAPHIGSAYTTVAADILARWHKQTGEKTFFMAGTDEHGAKIEAKAAESGNSPQEFVDDIAAQFQDAWQDLKISYNRFIRTTEPEHIKAVQNVLQFMHDKGDIYSSQYEGLYCKGCEQFKIERDLADGKCPDHGIVPELMSEECYMFKLSKYKDNLYAKIKNNELKVLPAERKNEVMSFYEREGLSDVAFSRKNVKWGIPLPWDQSQTAYVWADAFLNYLTGLGWDGEYYPLLLSRGGNLEFWPPDMQLMSKDILRIHTTIWPAMLLSIGLPLPKQIFVHGYFMVDGKKMSKSLGNVIRPKEMISRYSVDATRYLLISATPFGNDGDVSWAKFDVKYNADLANGLGNLVARVTNLLEKNEIKLRLAKDQNEFNAYFSALMTELKLDEAIKYIWDNLRALDAELAEKRPWEKDDKAAIKEILKPVAQKILSLSMLLAPFLPDVSEKIILQLSAEEIKKGKVLFPRI